ncbi:5648_t:CDS:2 [Gigaspora margarita]|uniref:5648_t:CDS:1 n=1 Tax=Gigaspora margarita TaxID=4874 RepID=A0ABN7UJG4_GIGMA|nr:5648_t:CDS:2 [Gigaspora margarita]
MPLLKLIKNKAELQVTTSTSLLKHKGTEALATELRLRQGFNNARIVNIMKELKFHFNFSSELWQIEQGRTPLNIVLGKVFNRKTANALKRLNLFTIAQLISADGSELIIWSQLKLCKKQSRRGDRRNRKLVSEYVISGYNLLALSIALPAVSLDKRKKELVLVENKDNNRKIFKIVQKSKAKILGEHYCNIPLADPNQFEIKKCKGYSRNIAKIAGKVDKEVCTSYFSWNKILGHCQEAISKKERGFWTGMRKEHPRNLKIELLKKQKLSKALELVLQKSRVRNMESNEQEFFFYTDSFLQLQKEN